MGLVIGLTAGLGLALCLLAVRDPAGAGAWPVTRRAGQPRVGLGVRAGVAWLSTWRLVVISVGGALAGFVVALLSTRVIAVAVAFGLAAAASPRGWLLSRAQRRVQARSELWPDVVDDLTSAVRAGLALPEALGGIGSTGPAELRAPFARFAQRYRISGSFGACLDALAADLADPVADRVIEALRIARDVGGTDLGVLLRSLSAFLREDARVRAEVAARQSWTVAAARLAVAAPWVVLLLLATQSSTVAAYNRPAGVVVLAVGGAVSWAAYRLMRRLGRLAGPGRA